MGLTSKYPRISTCRAYVQPARACKLNRATTYHYVDRMTDSNRLTEKQEAVVEVLRDGRATPKHIVDSSEQIPSKYSANDHLTQLRAKDVVNRVNKGLYELATDPSANDGMPAHSTLDTTASNQEGRCPDCATWALEQTEDAYVCRECEAEFTQDGGNDD